MVVKQNFQITNEHTVKLFCSLVDLSFFWGELDFESQNWCHSLCFLRKSILWILVFQLGEFTLIRIQIFP